ncbi:IclR family transcriptional regulator [Celeribacter sp. PS-C1]|uniref:IclR family transcriptional regulator n=1 Tax=Celeribacter sp. PS-C1 TaxID=2820813 RepID=UPI001C66DB2E|nr:IclR family transcriptional regulator [Celeribacter sp. PS-C1]MBW6419680.1 IclR family transcriptional regulator [Celeribacter sp. PS-C1]
MEETKDKSGKSQVVERTCLILRELGRHGPRGARLLDLTEGTGLSRPTVHRILATLTAEQFVERTNGRRYRLSSIMYELGLNAPSPVGDPARLRPIVQALADRCGDTVYLAMRTGDFSHYLLRCEGAYPIRTHVVSANQTLHLVSGHSGRSLLASMPEDEAEDVILRATQDRKLFGEATPDSLRDEVERVRENGYGWARDVTFVGVAGLTVPVPNARGSAYLAMSISSIPQRMTQERAMDILPELKATAAEIAGMISGD